MGADHSNGAEAVVLVTTVGDMSQARMLARALVERRLAACVSILPNLLSIYRWKGELQEDPELLLWIKSRPGLVAAVREAIEALHPYDVPELLVLSVVDGLPAYLEWLRDSTSNPETEVT